MFIIWGRIQPTASSMNATYFSTGTGEPSGTATDNIVNWCEQAGLYVIICPGWTTTWQPPAWAQTATGVQSGQWSGHVDLLYNTQIQNGVSFMYNWLAQRYATQNNVIFESFNELSSTPANSADKTAFAAFNNGWVSAIESGEGANSHLKIVQLLYDASAWNYSLVAPFINGSHTNLLLATHDYVMVKDTDSIKLQWTQIMSSTIHNAGYPWVDTEFGMALGGTYTNLAYAVTLFDTYNAAGWGYFCYDGAPSAEGNWNVKNPTNAASILPALNMGEPTPTNPVLTVNSNPQGIPFTLRRL